MASKFVAGIGGLLGKEVVGETIEGGFRVAAAGISAAGSAVGGALSGAGAALGGALQGAMTPAPTTVVNNVGMVGQAAKKTVPTGTGSLPAPKKKSATAVNDKMPTERLLTIAVNYLSSIDKTLQDQINFERLAYQRQVQAEKEASIEAPVTEPFTSLGEKMGAKQQQEDSQEASKGMSLAKKIIAGTALAGLGLFGLGVMTGDENKLKELKENWNAFESEYKWLFDLGKYLGAAAIGSRFGGVYGAIGAMVVTYLGERGLFDSIPILGDVLGNRGDAQGGPESPPGAIGMGITAGLAGYAGYRGVKTFRDIGARRAAMSEISLAYRADPRVLRTGRGAARAAAAGGGWLSGPKGQRFVAFLARRFGRTYIARKIMPLLGKVLAGIAITATGVGAIPGAIWTLINIGLSVWTVYDLIQAYWDWTDEEDARKDAVIANNAQPTADAERVTINSIPGAPRATAQEMQSLPAIPADIEKILATIRTLEGGGNYGTPHPIGMPDQTASGAYGMTNETWRTLTRQHGIGTEYSSAYLAPPPVQDAIAAKLVEDILKRAGGDVSKVPIAWYTGNIQGDIDAEALALNGGMTPAAYQSKWMNVYTGGQYAQSSYDSSGATAAGVASGVAKVTVEGLQSAGKFFKGLGRQLVGDRSYVPMSTQTSNPDLASRIRSGSTEIERASTFGNKSTQTTGTGLIPSIASLRQASADGTIQVLDPTYRGGAIEEYFQYHELGKPKTANA